MSVLPSALKPGDTIGVFAPSSWVDKDDIEKSKSVLEARGYNVFIHPQTYERENQSAGSHLQKALAFQGLWQRKDIKAIWAAGGGNRSLHLLETINFDRLKASPKLLIGFSDVTALINAVYAHTSIPAIHGPVFKNVHAYKQMDHLLDILSGKAVSYEFKDDNVLQHGTANGALVGGNLSLFQYLPQTLPSDFCKNTILFFEDCNEELSRIDRMLLHLKRLNVFEHAAGLIFGEFSDMTDSGKPFGYTLHDIIAEHTDSLDIPILYNMPFGHGQPFYSFPVGVTATLDTKTLQFKLAEPACTP